MIDFVTFLLYIGILKSVKPVKVKLLCEQISVSLDIFSQISNKMFTLTKPVDMGHMWPNSGNDMG